MKNLLLLTTLILITNITLAQPPNNSCATATVLTCGSGTLAGTTIGASDDNPPDCYFNNTNVSGGVWYTLEGNGDQITITVEAHPSGSSNPIDDSLISVWESPCGGGNVANCAASNSDHFPPGDGGSQVTFNTTPATTYTIYVDGIVANVGDFEITISCVTLPPDNNSCGTAQALTCNSGTILGTTRGGSDDNPGECQNAGDGDSPGVWYSFTGIGDVVTLTVNPDPTGTSHDLNDSQIAVYTGSCSGTLNCVTGNDDEGPYLIEAGSEVTFSSVSGTNYYIYVDGFLTFEGSFEITVTCPPSNNLCTNATPLTLGAGSCNGNEVNASNVATTASGISHTCGNYVTGDIWYSAVVPSSGQVSLLTAPDNSGSQVAAVMQAYSDCTGTAIPGGCSITGLLNLTGLTPGTTIYIAVYDQDGNDEGTFNICAWNPNPPSANNTCASAEVLTCTSGTVAGSTTNATNDNPPFCGSAGNTYAEGGVWYSFTGTGNEIILTVNPDPTGTANDLNDSQILVYTGGCNVLNCIAGNDDGGPYGSGFPNQGGSEVSFVSTLNTIYHIYITGFSTMDEGDFEIAISCPPSYNLCANALPLTLGSGDCGSNVVNVTNEFATASGISHNCGGYVSGDIWFKVIVPATGGVTVQATSDGSGSNIGAVMQAYSDCSGTAITGGCSGAGVMTLTGQTTGETIYIAAWDVSNVNQGTFNICAWEPALVLPVELVAFQGRAVNENVLLEWETASEENNDLFEIEHSRDGVQFEIIGSVIGAGTTGRIQTYEFWHNQPQLGSNYYRLKQVDFDGAFEHSEIRVVNFEPAGVNVTVYPNPATNNINVGILDNTSENSIQLFNSTGRLVLQRNMAPHSNKEVLQVSSLPRGIYLIKVDVDGRSFNHKIVLQ